MLRRWVCRRRSFLTRDAEGRWRAVGFETDFVPPVFSLFSLDCVEEKGASQIFEEGIG